MQRRSLLALLTVLLLVGCGKPAAPPAPPGLGDWQRMQGSAGAAAVRVDRVLDPLPTDPLSRAQPGRRLVGVWLTVRNRGQKPLRFVPASDVTLATASGRAPVTLVSGGPCRQLPSLRLEPGQQQQFCAAYQPKRGARLKAVEVALTGGAGSGRRSWSLG